MTEQRPLFAVLEGTWSYSRSLLFTSAIAVLAGVGHGHTAASASEVGVWLDHTGMGAVEISKCGAKLCGNIYWLKQPNTSKGTPLIDVYNPDASKRGRPICGLPVFGNLAKQSGGDWDAGWVYDPKDGKSYDFAVQLESRERMTVTGYMGTKMFGKSMTWTRAPASLPKCGTAAPTIAKAPAPNPETKAAAVSPASPPPIGRPAAMALPQGSQSPASPKPAQKAAAANVGAGAPQPTPVKKKTPGPATAARAQAAPAAAKTPPSASKSASAEQKLTPPAPKAPANVRSSSILMDGTDSILAPAPKPAVRQRPAVQ